MTLFKRHRLANGLTLAKLAARIGVSTAAVQTWEVGRCTPSAALIPKLAKALHLSPMALMELLDPDHAAPRPIDPIAEPAVA